MAKAGRPAKEFDKKVFTDLVGLGCSQEEICWVFRDRDTQKPANIDTLSRWCKREFGVNFQEYFKQNGLMYMKISLRRAGIELAKKNAAVHIFYCKNYLGMTDKQDISLSTTDDDTIKEMESYFASKQETDV